METFFLEHPKTSRNWLAFAIHALDKALGGSAAHSNQISKEKLNRLVSGQTRLDVAIATRAIAAAALI